MPNGQLWLTGDLRIACPPLARTFRLARNGGWAYLCPDLESRTQAFDRRSLMIVSPSATDAPEAFGSSLPASLQRDNLERARQYLAAIEGGASTSSPFAFLAPDI